MSRFQALTSDLLDAELDSLRAEMGFRESQKAELLRELASLASWLMVQARAGRTIEARGPDGVAVLEHPALRRSTVLPPIVLTHEEATELTAILDGERKPSAAFRATRARLKAQDRRPPRVRWSDR